MKTSTAPLDASDVVCVVRSVGERTTPACIKALHSQVGSEPIVVGAPVFRDTLPECFERALESGKPLLLTCDADVLPYHGAVDELLRLNAKVPAHYFQVVCEVDDHLFGSSRNGGLRLYRAEFLAAALEELQRSDEERPESGLVKRMAARGHPSAYGRSVLGLHDFGQFHRDVFRKAGFFAHKHGQTITRLAARWREGCDANADFEVALAGLAAGLLVDTPGPDLRTSLDVRNLGGTHEYSTEIQPLTDAEADSLILELPHVASTDEWVTFPAPRAFLARAREQRRLGRSVTADVSRRSVRALSRWLGA